MSFSELISNFWSFLRLPWAIKWRFLLVRAPWLVPLIVLRWTSEPPYPFIIYLPSRGKHRIPIYVFLPPHANPSSKALPVHLDFHGGGFIMGSCLEQAPFCAKLSRERGCIAISVDYRMGPMSQFPAAIEDAEDVLAAILDTEGNSPAGQLLQDEICKKLGVSTHPTRSKYEPILDPSHLSISGFSSGGNLALNMALSIEAGEVNWPSLLPQHPHPIPLLLFYPSFDARLLPHERPRPLGMPAPSYASLLGVLGQTYLLPHQRAHPRASPGLAETKEGLHTRAWIWLVLPEFDTLAVQSEVWVQKAREEGRGDVLRVERVKGMRHGWTQFPEWFLAAEESREKKRVFRDTLRFMEEVSPV